MEIHSYSGIGCEMQGLDNTKGEGKSLDTSKNSCAIIKNIERI